MVVSSTDGYCSLVSFAPGELGDVYHESQNGHQHETTPPPTIQHSLNNNKINGEVTPAEKPDTPATYVDRACTVMENNNSPTGKTRASVDEMPIQSDLKIMSLEKDVTPADKPNMPTDQKANTAAEKANTPADKAVTLSNKPATPVDTTAKTPIVIRRAGDR